MSHLQLIGDLDDFESGVNVEIIEGVLLVDVLDEEHENRGDRPLGQRVDDLGHHDTRLVLELLSFVLHHDVLLFLAEVGGVLVEVLSLAEEFDAANFEADVSWVAKLGRPPRNLHPL